MVSKIWTKPQTQQTIKALRNAGCIVTKLDAGYECYIKNELVFKAMIGSRGYLLCNNEST